MRARLLNIFTLFSSGSTLICCALPALFVTLGAGSVFASLVGIFPQLVWFSEHKIGLFILSGIFISISIAFQVFSVEACPLDPKLAKACAETKKTSRRMLIASTLIYLVGGFFAFIAPRL